MLIDWFTVIAQAINFFILVWLMKRFLYKPVLNAIDQREKLIAGRMADAKEKEQAARTEKSEFIKKNQDFDQQRTDLLKKATQDAEAAGKKILDDAKKAGTTLTAQLQETLKSDERNLHQEIITRIQQEVFSISRKVLTDLANTNIDKLIVEKFVGRLLDLKDVKNAAQKEQLGSAFGSANGNNSSAVIIRSSSDLPAEQRSSILGAIRDVFGFVKDSTNDPTAKIQFQTSKDLIGGFELTAVGQKITWNISDYLKSLEKGVDNENPRNP